jgi:hypothetical protein
MLLRTQQQRLPMMRWMLRLTLLVPRRSSQSLSGQVPQTLALQSRFLPLRCAALVLRCAPEPHKQQLWTRVELSKPSQGWLPLLLPVSPRLSPVWQPKLHDLRLQPLSWWQTLRWTMLVQQVPPLARPTTLHALGLMPPSTDWSPDGGAPLPLLHAGRPP